MTPLLTEAEREAVESAWLYPGHGHSAAENPVRAEELITTLAAVITRLLSARAVPMETAAWATADHMLTCSDVQKQRSSNLFGEMSESLVLRSAAEAYTAWIRGLLEEPAAFGEVDAPTPKCRNRWRRASRATTKEEGGEA